MTTMWPQWDRRHIDGLCGYVLPEETAHLGQFPPKSDRDPIHRLCDLYDSLTGHRIEYSHEPVGGDDGLQNIRTPYDVLTGDHPRGTCVEVAVVAASLCLNAGLHPYLIDVPGHALVAIWVGDGQPAAEVNWDRTPNPAYPESGRIGIDGLRRLGIRADLDDDGAIVALDITAVTVNDGSEPLDFAAAVEAGAALLDRADAEIRVCDIGWTWRPENQLNPAPNWDASEPLFPQPLFDDPSPLLDGSDTTGLSPTRLTRAPYRMVPFRPSDAYKVLVDRATTAPAGPGPTVLVVHGQGGAGKSRLAAETADHLHTTGWTTGVLRRGDLTQVNLDRLAAVNGPLFLAVDYAETTPTDDLTDLIRALQNRAAYPAVVVLLARTAGIWWKELATSCADNSLALRAHLFDPLPPVAVSPRALWPYSYRAFALRSNPAPEPDSIVVPPLPAQPTRQRWSSLDLVLLAWLAVHHPDTTPQDRGELYDEVLDHEHGYWNNERKRSTHRSPKRWEFDQWAAHLTTAAPTTVTEASVLTPDLDRDSLNAFATIWTGGFDHRQRCDPLQLQPDTVGDHLARRHFTDHPDHFATLTTTAADLDQQTGHNNGQGLLDRIAANLARSETDTLADPEAITRLWSAVLDANPALWRRLLPTAVLGSPALAAALEHAATTAALTTTDGQN
jgi:hypothetical protein